MSDPYKTLGINRNASDDEVKKAYRQLSRKYHPDANVGAANIDQIEEKFKEIQQAYQQVMDEREHGYSSSSYGSYGSGQANYSGEGAVKMQAAANFINSRHYQEALNVLNSVEDRSAQWYFFSSVANAGLGNNIKAREDISRATAMEPNNMQYAQFRQHLENGGTWYRSMGESYSSPIGGQNWCLSMCLLNLFCNCCRPC